MFEYGFGKSFSDVFHTRLWWVKNSLSSHHIVKRKDQEDSSDLFCYISVPSFNTGGGFFEWNDKLGKIPMTFSLRQWNIVCHWKFIPTKQMTTPGGLPHLCNIVWHRKCVFTSQVIRPGSSSYFFCHIYIVSFATGNWFLRVKWQA